MMGGQRPASKTAVVEEEREGAGITIEVLQQHFHQPLVTVAEELGVSLTVRQSRDETNKTTNFLRDSLPCCVLFAQYTTKSKDEYLPLSIVVCEILCGELGGREQQTTNTFCCTRGESATAVTHTR